MDHLRITVEGKVYDVVVEKIESSTPAAPAPVVRSVVAAAAPAAAPTPAPASAPAAKTSAAAGDVLSPLAGIVQAVEGVVGAAVNAGDLVITLEAMKMHTPINADSAGTIKAVYVKVGDAVEEGQPLYSLG